MDSNKDKKILLIFPPEWCFIGPHIALPSLSAQLKKEGYNSEVLDLNIKFFNDLLKKEHIENEIEKIKKLYKEIPLREDFETNLLIKEKYLQIEKIFKNINTDKLPALIDKAINTIKTPNKFKDIKQTYKALTILKAILDIAFFHHVQNNESLNYKDLKEKILNEENNIYYNYFLKIIPIIKEKNASFIGISVSSNQQAIAGLTLAYLLKKYTNTHINIGGSFFSHNPEILKKYPEIFDFFVDSISIGDGEHSIIELAKYINGENELENISNIAYLKNNEVFINIEKTNIQLSKIETPDFSDINFDNYITPFPILPISMTRGCYWNKCSFCVLGYEKNYSEKPIDLLIEELKYYKEKLNVSFFNIIDNSISPNYLDKLCDEILKNKLEIYFDASIRLEKAFNKKLLEKMFKAGFIKIYWGLESINQKTLNSMNKGINAKEIKKILKDASDVGIWNIAYFITGFPTESYEESQKTIDFIFKNKNIISEYCVTPFSLAKNSTCYKEAKKFGIKISEQQEDFSSIINFSYQNNQHNINQILNEIIKEKNKRDCINYNIYNLISHYLFFYIKIYGKKYLTEKKNKIF